VQARREDDHANRHDAQLAQLGLPRVALNPYDVAPAHVIAHPLITEGVCKKKEIA
jgi:hypothetical protein